LRTTVVEVRKTLATTTSYFLVRLSNRVSSRDDHGAEVSEWTPAGIYILGWSRSRSQYFRLEPEPEPEPGSILKYVQDPIKNFKGPDFCNGACCCQT